MEEWAPSIHCGRMARKSLRRVTRCFQGWRLSASCRCCLHHLFIAPVSDEERELSMLYLNHSCDPNLGVRGEITFVAMRDIRAGEELTHDWAMTDDDEYSLKCNCGASNCRQMLTGKDWQRPDLQRRYAGYFSAYLARKIALLEVRR